MKTLVKISQVLVGSLFIVSGLIKANDPLGFSYKLMDYFAVFDTEFLNDSALLQAVVICVVEVVLGVALLLGSRAKIVMPVLLLMILFFTWLTGYSAVTGKVTDCGCFGDALKLTPWQSFWKDVVLLVFILILFFKRNSIKLSTTAEDKVIIPVSLALIAIFSFGVIGWGFPVYFSVVILGLLLLIKHMVKHKQVDWIMAGTAVVLTTGFSIWCIGHLPIKDFRPYRVDNNLPDQMSIPDGAPKDVFEDTWYYKVNGETKEFTTADKPWEIEGATFVDRKTTLVQKGYEPPIHDFSISDDDGNNITDLVLSMSDNNFIVVAYDLAKTEKEGFKKIRDLQESFEGEKMQFIVLTASSYKQSEELKHDIGLPMNFYTSDATALKTIIRSNPGLLLMRKGTVIGKWHHHDIPTKDELKDRYLSP